MILEDDKLVYKILEEEKKRQEKKLILNAAVSITPESVLEIQSSILDNIDAEGYIPSYFDNQTLEELSNIDYQMDLYKKYKDDRCNKCCEYANIIEALAQKRLARVFANENAKEQDIYVNVQVPTGAIANFLIYEAFLNNGDTILSLDLSDGAHITHGSDSHITGKKYNFIHYHISMEKENIDYEEIEQLIKNCLPQMVVAGASSFPLNIDFKKIKEIINKYSPQTIFFADIAHTAGLIAGGVFNNPVGIADVVSMVTYKTFLGPRSAAIITTDKNISVKINQTVFPYFMGSPMLLNIAGVAVASNLALTDEYKNIQKQIVNNSRMLIKELQKLSIPVTFSNSDTHIVLIDCNKYGRAREIADYFEDCGILVNDCLVPSIKGTHEGIRIGTTWITQQGITDMKQIATFINEALSSYNTKNENIIKEKIEKYLRRCKNENI